MQPRWSDNDHLGIIWSVTQGGRRDSMVDAVVFDLGGVLLDWDPRHLYRKLIGDEEEMEAFLATVCTPAWHADHDLGVDIAASCEQLAGAHPQHAKLIRAWATRGEEMVRGEVAGTVQLLSELRRAGVACFALSNMEPETYALRRDRFEFMGWFDGVVISGHEGVMKPDARLFEVLVERFGLEPARTLLIDDREENVDAARRLGFRTVHFRSAEALRDAVAAEGLLPG